MNVNKKDIGNTANTAHDHTSKCLFVQNKIVSRKAISLQKDLPLKVLPSELNGSCDPFWPCFTEVSVDRSVVYSETPESQSDRETSGLTSVVSQATTAVVGLIRPLLHRQFMSDIETLILV